MQIDEARLAEVQARGLSSGGHSGIEAGLCAMEAAAYIAGEPWSDHPQCACPVITAFMISWNDNLSDEDRNRLILPLVPLTIGTRSTEYVEKRRALMAMDWYIRVQTPAWLRLAGLTKQADTLAGIPEITDMAKVPSIQPALEAVQKDASAARSAARSAAWSAARSAARSAAWSAARSAAESAAWSAAWSAARSAAESAAWSAAESAARSAAESAARSAAESAAWSAARSAVRDVLKPTELSLQDSALDLIRRMCAVKEPVQ
ncbi:hypothetical protein KFK14_11510 [Sphingobium phenoxybenzoativorans]|uniref:Uncharacterized protein n=1 Tax=Sphingobium phenoxybenzoativorans TaxID=1592790 RepID=A0A975KAT1_9SPHN|nr:hypothetical protein [Sphingobium phenoxybenzoativorans]QUT07955.1 hypothetical protein KFK14_11510 [Sphingobium phenoxybenzoativorans]